MWWCYYKLISKAGQRLDDDDGGDGDEDDDDDHHDEKQVRDWGVRGNRNNTCLYEGHFNHQVGVIITIKILWITMIMNIMIL